jgi:hypothetical protein
MILSLISKLQGWKFCITVIKMHSGVTKKVLFLSLDIYW